MNFLPEFYNNLATSGNFKSITNPPHLNQLFPIQRTPGQYGTASGIKTDFPPNFYQNQCIPGQIRNDDISMSGHYGKNTSNLP